MKNIIITSVAAVAVLAFAGCASKKTCGTAPVVVKAPVAVKVVAKPAPVVKAVEPVVVPVIDAKEAAVQ